MQIFDFHLIDHKLAVQGRNIYLGIGLTKMS
jgi:hypothetical protein